MPSRVFSNHIVAMKKQRALSYAPKQMFSREKNLDSLPVPPLQQTTERYLLSLQPLLDSNTFKNTECIVNEFRKSSGIGENLQERLVARSKKHDNWLADWWDNVAYFEYRNPVVIFSSPGITFPKQTFSNEDDQLRYSSRLIKSVLFMKDIIDSESVPVDMMGDKPMTMIQYKKLLSCCRLPHPTRDTSVCTPRDESRHFVIAHKNQFYRLSIDDTEGKELDEYQLYNQLKAITSISSHKEGDAVGILTAQNRTEWAKGYKALGKDVINRVILNEIASAICLICLDGAVSQLEENKACNENRDMTLSSINALHGGGASDNSCNRWFDKTVQFIVNEDGHVGCCFEHSAAEGPPIQLICNRIIEDSKKSFDWNIQIADTSLLEPPTLLKWKITESIKEQISAAKDTHDHLVDDTQVKVIQFGSFGKNIPKQYKMSPDAFIQIALQLAYFRLHNHMAPTYESAGTRTFKRGRTETIRSASLSAFEFCQSIVGNISKVPEQRELMMKAVQAHIKYTKEAVAGQGVDRHLLGLKLTALEANVPVPDIFRDYSFNYSMTFKLSTSQIPSPHDTVVVFGPATPDGYGVCYNPLQNHINFAITASNSNPETQVDKMAESITISLETMQQLLLTSHL